MPLYRKILYARDFSGILHFVSDSGVLSFVFTLSEDAQGPPSCCSKSRYVDLVVNETERKANAVSEKLN